MSDITINIPSDPFRTMIKTIIAEESLPTLFTRDAVADLIEGDGRIRDEIHTIAESVIGSGEAIERSIRDQIENSYVVEKSIKRMVENCVDYAEIASNIELSDLVTHISISDTANEINLGDLANEVNMHRLAEEVVEMGIDYELLAKALLRTIRTEASKTNA